MPREKRMWIQRAVKPENRGALRRYIRRRFGSDGFTDRDTIKIAVLRRLATDPHVSRTTRLRARFALTMAALREKKRRR